MASFADGRRHRPHRARPRRRTRRPRQARPAGRSDGRREDARRPRAAIELIERRLHDRRTRMTRHPDAVAPAPHTPASTRTAPPAARSPCRTTTSIGPIDSSDEWIRQRTGIITRTRAVAETHGDRPRDGCRAPRRSRSRASPPSRSTSSSSRRSATRSRRPSMSADRRRPRRREPGRGLRHQRRLRRLRLRRRAGRCADPRAAPRTTPLVIGAEKLSRRRRPDRPQHLVPARRRRRRGRHRPERHARHRTAPSGAPTARRPTPWA